MGTARTLLKGSFFRNADFLVALAAYVVITPILVRSLGDRLFGCWTLVGAFVGYYGLMDFGLSTAASRYLSQSLGKGDMDELNAVGNTALVLFSGIGAVVFLVAAGCALACPLFVADPVEAVLLRRIILMTGAATALGFPLRVYAGVLAAYLRYDVLAALSIARAALTNAAIYLALRRGGGLMTVAALSVAGNVLQNAATWAWCAARCPGVRIVPFRFEAARVRQMLDYSWKTFICQVGDVLRFRLDSVLVAGFLNVSLLTPFSIGVRLVDGFCYLVHNSVGMMIPVFSRYEGQGDYDAIRAALLKITRLSALLSAFVGLSLIFYASAFIRRWLGPGFEASGRVVAILCAGFLLELPQTPGVQLLFGLSRHEYYAKMYACEGAVNLALSLVFLKYFGLYGVALGTTVEMLVFKLVVQPVYICRVIQLPLSAYLGDMILGTLAKSGAILGLYFLAIERLVLPDYGRLAACLAGQTLLFVPAAYFLILTAAERRFAADALGVEEAFAALGLVPGPTA